MRARNRIIAAAALLLLSGGSLIMVNPFAAAAAGGSSDFGEVDAAVSAEAAAATTVPASCPAHPKVGKICGHTRILLVTYSVRTECQIQNNYPVNPGASPKTWTIKPGSKIIWRYNVNAHVALISDPARGAFPHWGFVTNSECIGTTLGQQGAYWRFEKANGGTARWVKHATPQIPAGQPIPQRTLAGRSQSAKTHYWNTVDWTPAGPAVPAAHQKAPHDRTLRDRPNEFVIGNVKAGWEIRPTGERRAGYTKVYVPSLKRWGWLQL